MILPKIIDKKYIVTSIILLRSVECLLFLFSWFQETIPG